MPSITLSEWTQLELVSRSIRPDSRLVGARRLTGGVSALVTALALELPDRSRLQVVLRQHGEPDLARNPRIATSEYRLLCMLRAAGVAAPRPLWFDESRTILPSPYVVLEYIEGQPEFDPPDRERFLAELAAHLARIHGLDCASTDLSFLPRQEEAIAERLAKRPGSGADEGRIWNALKEAWPPPRRNGSVLLHGDFWPGNVLWGDGRVTAIIDWEDAATGDPLSDVANARLEILWALGAAAMESFTGFYLAARPVDVVALPHWDLCAALRLGSRFADWAVDEATEKTMRERLQWFVHQALARLDLKK